MMSNQVLGATRSIDLATTHDVAPQKGCLAGRVVTKQDGNPVRGCTIIICALLGIGISLGMLIPGVQGLHGTLNIAHGGAIALVVLGSINLVCNFSGLFVGSSACVTDIE